MAFFYLLISFTLTTRSHSIPIKFIASIIPYFLVPTLYINGNWHLYGKLFFMKNLFTFFIAALLLACGETKPEQNEATEITEDVVSKDYRSHHIPEITQVFEAHGGFDTWSALKTLSYEMGGSTTLVELQNRYTRIESEGQTIGFDGENVWVFPASEDADRQRMRYNLMFYFYSFPFVVGDPGINYEVVEPIQLLDKSYNAVKVSYDSGIGDAPNDSYIVCSDPKTNQMEWLLYTATFGGESKDKYSLIRYEKWKNYGGVILPTKLQWYQYEDSIVGEPRGGGVEFQNISVSKEYPSMDNFTMPEGAVIASMPE